MTVNRYIYDIALSMLYRNRLRKALALLDRYGTAEEAWRTIDEPEMASATRTA